MTAAVLNLILHVNSTECIANIPCSPTPCVSVKNDPTALSSLATSRREKAKSRMDLVIRKCFTRLSKDANFNTIRPDFMPSPAQLGKRKSLNDQLDCLKTHAVEWYEVHSLRSDPIKSKQRHEQILRAAYRLLHDIVLEGMQDSMNVASLKDWLRLVFDQTLPAKLNQQLSLIEKQWDAEKEQLVQKVRMRLPAEPSKLLISLENERSQHVAAKDDLWSQYNAWMQLPLQEQLASCPNAIELLTRARRLNRRLAAFNYIFGERQPLPRIPDLASLQQEYYLKPLGVVKREKRLRGALEKAGWNEVPPMTTRVSQNQPLARINEIEAL
jgi:hypothetical protein